MIGCKKTEPMETVTEQPTQNYGVLSFHSSYDHGGGYLLLWVNGDYRGKIRAITPNVTCGDSTCKNIELEPGNHNWYVEDYEGNTWSGIYKSTPGDCELIDLWTYKQNE